MNNKPIATGTHDFKKIVESNSLYIDKTLFIKELIDDTSDVVCFPRPRRFGKTLNMSMLEYYFSLEYKGNTLFNKLKISKESNKYKEEMNKYPVISLSLKDTKMKTYSDFIINYKEIIKSLYDKYDFLLASDIFDETEKEDFRRFTKKEEDVLLPNALAKLVGYLNKYYGLQVIVLLDEYDAPILHAYQVGYYEEIIEFMKQLFVTTFKDNNKLRKGVITGISRVSKENLFSDANNIEVYNITDDMYSDYFGFTEKEVNKLLREYKLNKQFDNVKKWYDGYLFGSTIIYNPWSILKYLKHPKHKLQSYWVKTGGVDLLKNLIYNLNNRQEILDSYENLLKTDIIEHINLNVNLDLSNLDGDKDNIYTLFLLCGYLTLNDSEFDLEDATLRIPNLEVRKNLESIVKNWLKGPLKNYDFTKYLYENDIEEFKRNFKNIVIESFSYYDVPDNNNGENFYHAFTMGILSSGCSNYEITSNREAGYGRYDLILKPFNKNKTAYIIEFKVAGSDFDKAIEAGFKQIEENKYEVNLKDYKIVKMVIAFKGKKLKLETR